MLFPCRGASGQDPTRMADCRWQTKPAGNWCFGFSDDATMKLVEMNGADWGQTVASLHLTSTPSHGRAATLYISASATTNADWQDLIVLIGVVILQQQLIQRRRSSTAAATAGGAGGGGSC